MKLNFPGTTGKLKHAGFYIPFTVYFAVFAIACIISYKILTNNELNADSAYVDIFTLLIKVALYFTISIVSLSFVTVVASYLFYQYKKKKLGITFKISTDVRESDLKQKQTVKLFISPVLKPLFGFIKLRLLYDERHFSEKFSLIENGKGKFFSTEIEGTYHWPLPQIKEYHIEKAVLYFEDIFQFFSMAVNLSTSSHFFTQPVAKNINALNISPRKTEETTTRIEQLRRVEGEYLNYKNFENNDDVRRIVWKIYAKNKELVVRIPEIMDPYASHIYLYASFFTQFTIEGNTAVEIPFLNYYKILIWSVYQNLINQKFEVKFLPDQDVAKSNSGDEQQAVKYSISTSHWQQTKDLKSYVKPNDASIVVVSSLSNPDEVRDLMESHGREITFIFIKLTDSFLNQNMFDWVQWLFLQNQKDDIGVYKRAWSLSPLRIRIKENEKRLAEVVATYQEAVKL